MKFRYYITDLYEGKICGTDSSPTAHNYAICEDFFVVDTASGKWLTLNGEREIEVVPVYTEEEGEEE